MADRQDSDREILTSLPRSRPVRRSAKRGAPPAAAAAPRKASPTPAAARNRASRPRPEAQAEPERAGPPRKVPPAGYAAPLTGGEGAGDSGALSLLSTAVQAANELTQIGLTVGRQTLQSMLDRLPKL